MKTKKKIFTYFYKAWYIDPHRGYDIPQARTKGRPIQHDQGEVKAADSKSALAMIKKPYYESIRLFKEINV